jgi:hypothetical protein
LQPKLLVEEALEMIDDLGDEALDALPDQSRKCSPMGSTPPAATPLTNGSCTVSDDGILRAAKPAKVGPIAMLCGLAGSGRARHATGLGH